MRRGCCPASRASAARVSIKAVLRGRCRASSATAAVEGNVISAWATAARRSSETSASPRRSQTPRPSDAEGSGPRRGAGFFEGLALVADRFMRGA